MKIVAAIKMKLSLKLMLLVTTYYYQLLEIPNKYMLIYEKYMLNEYMRSGEEHPAQREHHNGGHLQRCPRYQTKVPRSGVLRYLASYDLVFGMISLGSRYKLKFTVR